jgi:hypothetical protein
MPGAMKSQSGNTGYGKNTYANHGGATVKSRAREQGFELGSRGEHDMDLPVQGAKTFWGKGKQLSDSDSEQGVLRDGSGKNGGGEIMKTVSVMITDRSRSVRDDESTSESMRKFEHV